MKTSFYIKPAIYAVAAVLAFSPSVTHADDEKKPVKRHGHRLVKTEKAAKATAARPASKATTRDRLPAQDGRNSQDTQGNSAGVANGPEYRVPTGSHIPRHYNRRGTTTDSYDNSTIIDENDQRFRQHDTPSEILRTDPSISVRGPRGL